MPQASVGYRSVFFPSPPREGHFPHSWERSQDLLSVHAEGNVGFNCLGKIN